MHTWPCLLLHLAVSCCVTTPGEIGVPPYFAMRLSFPEAVTHHNVERLRQLVINGAFKYPGALAVEDCTGRVISLGKADAKVCVWWWWWGQRRGITQQRARAERVALT